MSGLSRQARRLRALAGLALGAALMHALLLGTLDGLRPGRAGPTPSTMTVMLRAPQTPEPATATAPAAPRVEGQPVRELKKSAVTLSKDPDPSSPKPPPRLDTRATEAPAEIAPLSAAAASGIGDPVETAVAPPIGGSAPDETTGAPADTPEPIAASPGPTDAPLILAAAAQRDPEPAAVPAEPTPVYRTRFPPALTLHYDLARGALGGRGELVWQPGPEGYTLKLGGTVAGLAVLTQTSEGGFDAAGLAPRRFTDQRLRRAAQAANFQRESGRISFSGPSIEFALRPGTQDRLSWMIQLAAVLAADPRLAGPGGRVLLPVVGARGDFSVWAFAWVDAPPLATRAGAVATAHFVREPRSPQDTRVEVWLDPARQHLPVRATLRNAGDGDALELQLQSIDLH